MVSWPLLERAGEERDEDLDGRIRPGLGVLRVRVLESKPEQEEDKIDKKRRKGRDRVNSKFVLFKNSLFLELLIFK